MERRPLACPGLGHEDRAGGEVERRDAELAGNAPARRAPVEAARDHQVEHQVELLLEADHQALAEPAEQRHPPALGGRDGRLHRAQEERAPEPHALERLRQDAGLQALEVDGDVGQLGHGAGIVPGPPRRLNPASLTVGLRRRAGEGGLRGGRWRRDARQGILVDLQVG